MSLTIEQIGKIKENVRKIIEAHYRGIRIVKKIFIHKIASNTEHKGYYDERDTINVHGTVYFKDLNAGENEQDEFNIFFLSVVFSVDEFKIGYVRIGEL